jgi:hypothetical protein
VLLGAPALVHLDDDADLPAVLYSMLHLWAVHCNMILHHEGLPPIPTLPGHAAWDYVGRCVVDVVNLVQPAESCLFTHRTEQPCAVCVSLRSTPT